jgi:hypothetical protein
MNKQSNKPEILLADQPSDQPVCCSLGSNANNVAAFGKTVVGQQITETPKVKPKRAKNKKIKAAIKRKKMSASERIYNCGYKTIGHFAEIHYNAEHGSAKVANVETCGSVWACPVCRTKILNGRADELKTIGEGWRADGGKTAMLTLTVPHYKNQSLQTVLGSTAAKTGLSGAFYRLRQQRAWRVLKQKIGYAADVRVYEVTNGKINGWHPHIHLILYYKKDIDINSFTGQFYDLWRGVCEASGLGTPNEKNGVKITNGADEYLAKWGAPNELTSDQQKEAKNGNKTIAELENGLLTLGDTSELEMVLREYYVTMTGRKMLTWGGENLRKKYLAEPDKTDEDLAIDEHANGERLFVIERKTWEQIYNTDEVGEMLDAVEADKENGLFAFLYKYKICFSGVRRTIKDFDSQSLPPPKPAKWGNYKWVN